MRPSGIIGVIGASRAEAKDENIAYEVGQEIALKGYILLCGGLGGIMVSACKGAKFHNGTTVGILPGEDSSEANKYVDIPIVTGFSHARNIIIVRSSNAIIAVGGEFGTLSEIAFALKLNKPVIGINTWNVSESIIKAYTAKEAVDKAVEFIASGNNNI